MMKEDRWMDSHTAQFISNSVFFCKLRSQNP